MYVSSAQRGWGRQGLLEARSAGYTGQADEVSLTTWFVPPSNLVIVSSIEMILFHPFCFKCNQN